MARTYDPETLATPNVSSEAWALNWVRATLRDVPNDAGVYPEGSYTDEEIKGALALYSVKGTDDVVLYAPHVVAAALVENDPRRALSYGVAGLSGQLPNPREVAAAILRSGSAIDSMIRDAGGVPPSTGRSRIVETLW